MVIKRETGQGKHNRGCRSETEHGEEAKQKKESTENGAEQRRTVKNQMTTTKNAKDMLENIESENNVEKEKTVD